MNAVDFFQEVCSPNIALAVNDDGDYRHAVNAILSLDAAVGILFVQLSNEKHPYLDKVKSEKPGRGLQDSDLKNHLAGLSIEYRVARDTAYALKHGRLNSGTRLVRSAREVSRRKLVCGTFRCGDALGSSAVFIDISGEESERAWLIIRRVEMFIEALLGELGLTPLACAIPSYHAIFTSRQSDQLNAG